MRGVARVAALAAAAAGLVVVASSVHHSYVYTHPARARVSHEERLSALERLPGLESVEMRTKDDLVLRGWFVPGPRKDAIVLVHGLGGNRLSLLPEAEILIAHGHGVLLYDSRASGDSDGTVATWGDRERMDVAAATELLSLRHDVDATRIGIYGISVGATAAAFAAAENTRLSAVLLGPIWPSLGEELANKFPNAAPLSAWAARRAFQAYGVDVDALETLKAIRSIPPRRVMLLSGSADDDTPPPIMARIHDAVPTADWWLVPGAGHGDFASVAPVEYARRFARFFDESLAPHDAP